MHKTDGIDTFENWPGSPEAKLHRESWKVFQVMGEFVEGFDKMAHVHPAVSIFGSSRTEPGHPWYELTESIARELSNSGFSIISGGGPGIMEAANRGAQQGRSPSIGLNIILPGKYTDPFIWIPRHRGTYQPIMKYSLIFVFYILSFAGLTIALEKINVGCLLSVVRCKC